MQDWNKEYLQSLKERFSGITDSLDDRLEAVIQGRVAPAAEDIPIGSAKQVRAAVLFFDIRSFSEKTMSAELSEVKKALYMLDTIIPMVMYTVFDHGGYVEKNTGDGIMAVFGVELSDSEAANSALSAATAIFYLIKNIVNPNLLMYGISGVNARIGIDLGTLLLARIGTPTGTAKHDRNFLTAVGPSANLACRLQQMSGTDQIWVGDLIRQNALEYRQKFFEDVTPSPWTWTYKDKPNNTYRIWNYNAVKLDPS
jgi:class 3 adenylate cyclase